MYGDSSIAAAGAVRRQTTKGACKPGRDSFTGRCGLATSNQNLRELAAITGLTTGAITGVVARLEKAGFLHREPDPHDRRKQILRPALERIRDIHAAFAPIRKDATALLESFDTHQLTAIAKFLAQMTELAHRHAALLGADTLHDDAEPAVPRKATKPPRVRSKR
jgi:DNA-binding MarR family transcriptional regulator